MVQAHIAHLRQETWQMRLRPPNLGLRRWLARTLMRRVNWLEGAPAKPVPKLSR
jgi:hypothetical protein